METFEIALGLSGVKTEKVEISQNRSNEDI